MLVRFRDVVAWGTASFIFFAVCSFIMLEHPMLCFGDEQSLCFQFGPLITMSLQIFLSMCLVYSYNLTFEGVDIQAALELL